MVTVATDLEIAEGCTYTGQVDRDGVPWGHGFVTCTTTPPSSDATVGSIAGGDAPIEGAELVQVVSFRGNWRGWDWEDPEIYTADANIKYSNGAIYTGPTKGGRPCGEGMLEFDTAADPTCVLLKWEGTFVDHTRMEDGARCAISYVGGDVYVGPSRYGQRDGFGTLTRPCGMSIRTEWKDGHLASRTGRVVITYGCGAQYVGGCNPRFIPKGVGVLTYASPRTDKSKSRAPPPTPKTITGTFSGHFTIASAAAASVVYSDGSHYEGQISGVTPWGAGVLTYALPADGKANVDPDECAEFYKGAFSGHYQYVTGRAEIKFVGGGSYAGRCVGGVPSGIGVSTTPFGVRRQCKWASGRPVDGVHTFLFRDGLLLKAHIESLASGCTFRIVEITPASDTAKALLHVVEEHISTTTPGLCP